MAEWFMAEFADLNWFDVVGWFVAWFLSGFLNRRWGIKKGAKEEAKKWRDSANRMGLIGGIGVITSNERYYKVLHEDHWKEWWKWRKEQLSIGTVGRII